MKIGVLGIGGVGGFVGGALCRVNKDTYFCARGENLAAIKENGLRVDSERLGSFTAHPAACGSAEETGRCDAVIIACKGQALAAACASASASPMIARGTVVVPLLNGLLVSEIMKPLLPPCTLADGVIRIFSHIGAPGHIVQESGACSVITGMKGGEAASPALVELCRLMCEAGVPARLSDEIEIESWKKFVLMCGNSVIFGLYGGAAGVVRADPGHAELCRAVWREQLAVAESEGVKLPDDMIEKNLAEFERHPDATITSLYRDLSAGKKPEETELAHLVGRIVALGRKNGIATPLHSKMFEKYGGRL
ncbi:MAG: 2-dehydropantoate 2-reductase [Synergistaceae bacterium]|nr:2-dehydropantoate 2-reductase [Synergistaceae bacterium]